MEENLLKELRKMEHQNMKERQKENVPGYVCNPGSPRERDAASKR